MDSKKGFSARLFSKKNTLPLSALLIVVGAIVALAIGIPLSQSVDNSKRARQILSKYVLIDG